MRTVEIRVGDETLRGEAIGGGAVMEPGNWSEEGNGRLTFANGKLGIDAMEGGYSAFFRGELPGDLLLSFRARLVPPEGAGNINIITHCQPERAGFPISPTGAYDAYHLLPNYIVTFVKDEERLGQSPHAGRTRLRRNPGFRLIAEAHPESAMGREYQVVFACKAGRVRYYLDSVKLHEWLDPDPLPGGLFALRTYKTALECRDLLICRAL